MRTLNTSRLLLRDWKEEDLDPLAAMCADPRVMEYFFGLMNRSDTEAMLDRMRAQHSQLGFGYLAVEIPGVADFAGFIGLGIPRYQAEFTPCIEIGWRLAFDFWGYGYAAEGAIAMIEYAFQELRLDAIVATTVEQNWRSRRVMEKLGMQYCSGQEFIHPLAPVGHPNALHVLYRLLR